MVFSNRHERVCEYRGLQGRSLQGRLCHTEKSLADHAPEQYQVGTG